MSNRYDELTLLDAEGAIKKCGSEDFFRRGLKLFCDSAKERKDELMGLFTGEDWQSYTIKIHALKGAARIIGAMKLGDEAESLEMAGKRGDHDFIRANHSGIMEMYDEVCGQLKLFCEAEGKGEGSDLPEADPSVMDSFFKRAKTAAEDMDYGGLGDLFDDMEAFSIPQKDKELFDRIWSCFDIIDYDGIIAALDGRV